MRPPRLACVAVGGVVACGRANFDPTWRDAMLDADGPAHNRAFVTSTLYGGNFGGRPVADAECQARAEAAGMHGTFLALMRTGSERAADRFIAMNERGWVDTTGLEIVDQPAGWLDGSLQHPLQRDELGDVASTNAWMGYTNGTCQEWSSASAADRGGIAVLHSTFNELTYSTCEKQRAFVCLEVGHPSQVQAAPQAGRIAFLTDNPWTPSGGLAGADARCNADAAAHSRSGNFRAYLTSSAGSAASRFSTSGPTWVRTDGIPLSANAADVFDAVVGPPQLDTFWDWTAGNQPRLRAFIWTGISGDTCSDWTSSSAAVMGGNGIGDSVDRVNWAGAGASPCNSTNFYLVCAEP